MLQKIAVSILAFLLLVFICSVSTTNISESNDQSGGGSNKLIDPKFESFKPYNAMLNCCLIINNAVLLLQGSGPQFSSLNSSTEEMLFFEPYIEQCIREQKRSLTRPPLIAFGKFEPIRINYTASLQTIYSLNNEGALLVSVVFFFKWEDKTSTWPQKINGFMMPKNVWLTRKDIWYPVFEVERCLNDKCNIMPAAHTSLSVSMKGGVDYTISQEVKTCCEIDLANFPFDAQTCRIEIFMREYRTTHVIVQKHRTIGEMKRHENDEWHIAKIEDIPKNFTIHAKDTHTALKYEFDWF